VGKKNVRLAPQECILGFTWFPYVRGKYEGGVGEQKIGKSKQAK
jgi:hypothetical protein